MPRLAASRRTLHRQLPSQVLPVYPRQLELPEADDEALAGVGREQCQQDRQGIPGSFPRSLHWTQCDLLGSLH